MNPTKSVFEKWSCHAHGEAFGVRRVLAAFRRRLVAVACGEAKESGANGWLRRFLAPLYAALLGRLVGEADKAATSRRTPKRERVFRSFQTSSKRYLQRQPQKRTVGFPLCRVGCVGLLGALLTCRLQAVDWPTYQHDYQRSGLTQEGLELPLTITWVHQAKAPAPAWTDPPKADYYTSAPQQPLKPRLAFDRAHHVAVVGNRLYFGSSVEHTVNCLNADTGASDWTFFTDGPVRMTPTVQDGRVYAGSDDGSVYCLNATNAALIWKHTPVGITNFLVANDGNFISPFAIRSSVAVDQGVAYFTSGFFPHEGVFLCAVDAATGTKTTANHWQRSVTGTAALQGYMLLSSTKIFMPGSRSSPYYFDRGTGSLLGQYSGAMGTYALLAGNSFFYGPAARGGGQITEGGLAGDTIASYNSGNAIVVTATRTYLLGDSTLSALDRTTRATVWSKSANYPYALILAGPTLFAGGENEVAAFDSGTGNRIWSSPVNGSAYGLAVANGRLFVSTDTGYIYSFVQDQSSKQSTWMLY